MTKDTERLFAFTSAGTSAFHTVAHAAGCLEAAGFKELSMQEDWQLKEGGAYFVQPFATTLYAFTVGKELSLSNGIHIAGAHTDFPAIKLKPNPELLRHGCLQLNTEVYGGPILNTFFDRSLSLAGRVVTRGETYDKPVSHLVDFKRPIICLPNLAIHMNRSVNEKGAPINNQKHLLPILATTLEKKLKGSWFKDVLAKEIGVPAEDILDFDLCLYNMDQPRLCGLKEEFVLSPRLDDLTCVSAMLHGLIDAGTDTDRINLVCLVDNEEIGSLSKQGADSSLPGTVIRKIWKAFGKDATQCMSDLTGGMMLSADVAHAYHPNYPDLQDITNYPVMGRGFCIKTAGNQSYAWDSEMTASLIDLCQRHHIPFQRFVKNSNVKGGGTIGSIISSHLPMRTADIGVGILAMHSSCEMMGAADQDALSDLARAFFR